MKKLLYLLLLLPLGLLGQTQTSQVTILNTTGQLASYRGGSKIVIVRDTALGGEFYKYTGPVSVDGVNIFTGSGGAKWRRVPGEVKSSLIPNAIGSSPNANGITISGDRVTLQPYSGSFGGLVTTGAQTGAGIKSWTDVLKYTSDLIASYDDRTLADWGNVHKDIHDTVKLFGGVIFDQLSDVGNTTTTETDLHTKTLDSNFLDQDGEKINFKYEGTFFGSASTKQLRVYFGGTVIFNSTAQTVGTSCAWSVEGWIARVDVTTIRSYIRLTYKTGSTIGYVDGYAETTVDLVDENELKITGQAAGGSAATNDIILKMTTAEVIPGTL